MALKWIRKVAATPLNTIAKVINSFNTQESKTTNAPSLQLVEDALGLKQNTLTFDTEPTSESTNPVTSGGVHAALADKQDNLTFDAAPTSGSSNPVTSGGIHTALAAKQNNLTAGSNVNISGSTISATDTTYSAGTDLALSGTTFNHKTSGVTAGAYTKVTVNSRGHVTAGSNPTTLAGYGITDAQGKLTFDNRPTAGSNNPVTSNALYKSLYATFIGQVLTAVSVPAGLSWVNIYYASVIQPTNSSRAATFYSGMVSTSEDIAILACAFMGYSGYTTGRFLIYTPNAITLAYGDEITLNFIY